MTHPFRAMQPITLCIERGGEQERFPSLVLDYTEEKELIVGVPVKRGVELHMHTGEPIGVELVEANGIWLHETVILRRTSANPPSLVLEWPHESKRTQRRNDVRVEVLRRAKLRMIGSRGSLGDALEGTTVDVSAGGVRLSLPESVPPQTEVEVELDLPEVGTVRADGQVVRWGEIVRPGSASRFWVAVEFTRVDAAVRRELTKFVFNVQREQIRKGVV